MDINKANTREVEYLFHTLEKEWMRSGKTVVMRRMGQDEIDYFTEYYDKFLNQREKEISSITSFRKYVSSAKEMSTLLRILEKITKKLELSSTKKNGYFLLELDKDERKVMEEIIGTED